MVRLTSPVIPVTDEPQLCFSFWYAAFGAGESALLQIMRQDNSSGETPAEKVSAEITDHYAIRSGVFTTFFSGAVFEECML